MRVRGSTLAGHAPTVVGAGDGVLILDGGATEPCLSGTTRGNGAAVSFYDPATATISRVRGGPAGIWFAATTLQDGRVLVAGGDDGRTSGQPTRRSMLWDPSIGRWTDTGPMRIGRIGPALVTMGDGRVMAAGGSISDPGCGERCWTDTMSAELYDPATGRWTAAPDVPLEIPDGGGPDQLSRAIVLGDGRVLAVGENDSAAVFDPASGTWSAIRWTGGWRPVAMPDGSTLGFGSEYTGPDNETEFPFVVRLGLDARATNIAHWRPAVGAALTVMPDGRLFVAGGVEEDGEGYLGVFIDRAEIFDPSTGNRRALAPMPLSRLGGEAVPLGDGSVLVVGGVIGWEDEEQGESLPPCVAPPDRVVRWRP